MKNAGTLQERGGETHFTETVLILDADRNPSGPRIMG